MRDAGLRGGMRALGASSLIVGSLILACGTPAGAPDAAAPDAPDRADAGPIAAPPAPPQLTPCPTGWRELEVDGIPACDPFPEGGARTDCADDEAHFPGEPGCARVGTPCEADGWPASLPSGPTIFVRAGGTGDGTSRAAPLATIGAALARATAGTLVAVGAGTYDEAIVIPAGVTVRGACVAGTRITSSAPDELSPVVDAGGAGAAIENLAIGDADRPGVFLEDPAATLRIEDVIVEHVITLGIAADHARIDARSVVVRDVESRASDGMFGRGLSAAYEGVVTVERAVIERTRTTGIFAVFEPARLTLRDAVVRDSRERAAGQIGRGAAASMGAGLELERVAFERSRELGVLVSQGATASLRDVIVRDTVGRDSDGMIGIGVEAESSAVVELDRVRIERSLTGGLVVADAQLAARDLVVADTEHERGTSDYGFGVSVLAAGSLSLTRATIVRSRQAGVGADGSGTSVALEDVTIASTRSRAGDGRLGVGLWAQRDAAIAGRRVLVRDARMTGVGAVNGASITLEDARIVDTIEAECGDACPEEAAGFGAVAHFLGGRLRLTRFEVDGAALCGVAVGLDPDTPGDTGGELDLDTGVITRAPIGACVQVGGYDLARLRTGVSYVEVGVPLQATSYRLPSDVL